MLTKNAVLAAMPKPTQAQDLPWWAVELAQLLLSGPPDVNAVARTLVATEEATRRSAIVDILTGVDLNDENAGAHLLHDLRAASRT